MVMIGALPATPRIVAMISANPGADRRPVFA
jgi:hypothetical protein